ncbi:MAG: hypothetical protein Q8Q09_26420 [Deltaproteobacteria bacterium]|nr:hypothetical protein [Deltaproteobacteria bacterium]
MAESAFDVHGVTVHATLDDRERVLGPVLARLGHAELRAEPSLSLRVRVHDEPCVLSEEQARDPRFFFGLSQGYVTAQGYALSDAGSTAVIDCAQRSVTVAMYRDPVSGACPATSPGLSHSALCLALREWELFELHAACVVDRDLAALIVGDSGSGKTSTTLAMITAGASFLADDRVLLRRGSGAVQVCAYPRDFHVTDQTMSAHQALRDRVSSGEGTAFDHKRLLDGYAVFSQRFVRSWGARKVLVLPSIRGESGTLVRRVSASEGFGHLLESSALALVDGVRKRSENLAVLRDLANESSAFEVQLGREWLENPAQSAMLLWAQLREMSRS